MNLPNKVTFLRMGLVPIFIFLLFYEFPYHKYLAGGLFILLAISDGLDGYLARKRKEVTTFGGFLDPLADKLLVSAALIFLIGYGVDAWMVFVIIAREFCVSGLRTIAAVKKVIIHAQLSGKIKTLIQIIAVLMVIFEINYAWWAMLLATIVSLISGIDYFVKARALLKE